MVLHVVLFAVTVIAGLLVVALLGIGSATEPKNPEVAAASSRHPSAAQRAKRAPDLAVRDQPRQVERAPSEWQGMLTDGDPWPCESTAVCGLARACIDGYCVGCRDDEECVAGEVCVLEHCVKGELARCRSARDCARRELCVMSGYSSGPRANEELRSTCLPAGGPGANPFFEAPQEEALSAPPTSPALARNQELLDDLKRKIGARATSDP
ncbi:MAG: hypothetical protein IT383_10220 [Deltaproteobacteria bacterium]|nr:hypothetical protein [Deltaproteobacteria bacterium]